MDHHCVIAVVCENIAAADHDDGIESGLISDCQLVSLGKLARLGGKSPQPPRGRAHHHHHHVEVHHAPPRAPANGRQHLGRAQRGTLINLAINYATSSVS